MFYRIDVQDHIRVPPHQFNLSAEEAITKQVKEKYDGMISKDFGIIIDVSKVKEVGEGIIISGDGAAYYDTKFELLTFIPEAQEVVLGKIKDIADFGAFINMGPIDGMIHVSQTMNDFVSFSKDKVLMGKETKRTLKSNDLCRARVVAISFKDLANPKIGLTMRQLSLGKLEWIEEENQPKEDKKITKEKK